MKLNKLTKAKTKFVFKNILDRLKFVLLILAQKEPELWHDVDRVDDRIVASIIEQLREKKRTKKEKMKKQIYYQTEIGDELPILWKTKKQAIKYVSERLDGTPPGCSIAIMVREMTADEYERLQEF